MIWGLKFNPTNPTNGGIRRDGDNGGATTDGRNDGDTVNGRSYTCILGLGTIYLL